MTANVCQEPARPAPACAQVRPSAEAAGGRQPIKVMLVTVGLDPGGVECQVAETASRLDRSRFDVLVCCLRGDGKLAQELRGQGVRVVTLDGRGKLDIRVAVRLFRLVRSERPAVVHAHLFWANLAARVVARLLRIPVVVSSYHGLEVGLGWPHLMMDRLTARWAHAMTCCSESVGQFLAAHIVDDRSRCVTIHNGVDIERFMKPAAASRNALGLRADLPVIGTVCRLAEPEKGLAVLLQAMARLNGASGAARCQLVIVGEGPARAHLHELTVRLGLAGLVVFTGMRRDVAELLSLMDVFVLPSRSEGFGLAAVEAMAAGRPVVATAVGGIPEVVVQNETGVLVPPGDPRALAEAIEELLRDPSRRQSLGSKGRQRARERFAIEAVVRQQEQLYTRLLGHGA